MTLLGQKSDTEIVIACQRFDKSAFEELVRRNQLKVYQYLYHQVPDFSDSELRELTQEVFIKIWNNIASLKEPASYKTWQIVIAKNLLNDNFKHKKKLKENNVRMVSIDEGFEDEEGQNESLSIPDNTQNPETVMQNKELSLVIREALAKIPEQYREAIVLNLIGGFTYEQISKMQQVEIGTVKSRISRARKHLQPLLAPYVNFTKNVQEVKSI